MLFEMVLNDLSARSIAVDLGTARTRMDQFVVTIRDCATRGVPRILRVPEGFRELPLAQGYSIGRWAFDRLADADRRRYLLALATKSPYLNEILEPNLETDYRNGDFRFLGQEARGLAVAYLIASLAVSLPTEGCWDVAQLGLSVTTLDERTEELATETVRVYNASQPRHVVENGAWIDERRRLDIRDGVDLWNRRQLFFPALLFCDSVHEQVGCLSGNDPTLRIATQALIELQNHCVHWTGGQFNGRQINNCSTESTPTIEQYGAQRLFICPDGEQRLFSWHLKRQRVRIHFLPQPQNRQIVVGYIGKYLPTVRYPN